MPSVGGSDLNAGMQQRRKTLSLLFKQRELSQSNSHMLYAMHNERTNYWQTQTPQKTFSVFFYVCLAFIVLLFILRERKESWLKKESMPPWRTFFFVANLVITFALHFIFRPLYTDKKENKIFLIY